MSAQGVIDIEKWIAENGHLLEPPVSNYCLQRGGFTVMLVGGPNDRQDYHLNQTPEWFYQLKGRMTLKIVDRDGTFQDIEIKQGETYLLPPNTWHCPTRYQNTIGLVVEVDRPTQVLDKMRWYCPDCKTIVYETEFHCSDLGTQVKEAISFFHSSSNLQQCRKCNFNFQK